MAARRRRLKVAITGPTGTLGQALVPQLERDPRIGPLIGVARRAFDPIASGWTSMTYVQGDVRDERQLVAVFRGADVVIHLAFLIAGTQPSDEIRAINVEGTLNAFRAAVETGAARFVYASSAAAYGFHPDNPIGMTEDWPIRADHRFFYAEEKADLEHALQAEANANPGTELYIIRPPVVLGPHAVGAKSPLPAAAQPVARAAVRLARRLPGLPFGAPMLLPRLPLQFVHEDDVAQALVLCAVGAGRPGAYNIAGDGVLTAHDLARELGFTPLPVPLAAVASAARAFAGFPWPAALPPATGWAQVLSHPVVLDTTKAKRELGWRPDHTGLEALHATLHPPA